MRNVWNAANTVNGADRSRMAFALRLPFVPTAGTRGDAMPGRRTAGVILTQHGGKRPWRIGNRTRVRRALRPGRSVVGRRARRVGNRVRAGRSRAAGLTRRAVRAHRKVARRAEVAPVDRQAATRRAGTVAPTAATWVMKASAARRRGVHRQASRRANLRIAARELATRKRVISSQVRAPRPDRVVPPEAAVARPVRVVAGRRGR